MCGRLPGVLTLHAVLSLSVPTHNQTLSTSLSIPTSLTRGYERGPPAFYNARSENLIEVLRTRLLNIGAKAKAKAKAMPQALCALGTRLQMPMAKLSAVRKGVLWELSIPYLC